MKEIYFSTDVETDGPIPGPHSMLSFGSAAFFNNKLVDTLYVNLETLEGATGNPDTMKWWGTQPEAWTSCRKDPRPPSEAMPEYVKWVNGVANKFGAQPVFVAYPAGFDFLFMYWYMMRFAGSSPFSFSALDIKSYVAGKLNKPYRECTKKNMPRKWFGTKPHTHNALDDAIEQGDLFCNILKD
jgi:hypothetical protein